MSAVADLTNKIFNDLANDNVVLRIRSRDNPLISEYVIKLGDKCPNLNVSDDIALDRESTWYMVLTMGMGTKLGINRVSIAVAPGDNVLKLSISMMSGDRLKSSEEFVFSCGEDVRESMYGKSVIDLLINLDLITRFLNMIKERKKLGDVGIDELVKFLSSAKSKVDQDLKRLFSMYQWLEE